MTYTNEGVWDRTVRILAGIALLYAAWTTWPESMLSQSSATSLVFLIVGAIALFTGVIGWCAAYAVFGISTKKKEIAG